MRSAICRRHGPPEVVLIEDQPPRPLVAGEVRVRVGAASVNFPDVLIVADEYQVSVPVPFVPGSEFAGVVAEVAGDVADIALGDRVSGTTLVGAFAEEVIVSAGALTATPRGMDTRTAAASGVAHRTAFHVLRSVARLAPGEELIVLGAGGGVGVAAVQLGAALGASVTAVASSAEKLEVAAAHGARHLVQHGARDLRESLRDVLPDGADIVVDPVGGDLATPALRSLRYGGRFVTVGYASGTIPQIPLNLVLLKGIEVAGFQFVDFATHHPEERRRNEDDLRALFESGRARPHIGASFALDDAPAALRYVADGRAIGKVVLEIGAP